MSFAAHETDFTCKLECCRCEAETKTGGRCKRRTKKQLPYCYEHTRSLLHVDIRPSTIPGAGKGLFALQEFNSGDLVVPYKGEVITKAQMDERYSDGLAPFALQINKNTYIDSACQRGTASFINTNPKHNNARFSVYSGRSGHPPGATVRATKKIPVDAEIFVDYGEDTPKFLPKKVKGSGAATKT